MIEDMDLCTGCRACEQICPVGCISFSYDLEGFIYPKVNLNKCIHCNKCESVCHAAESNKKYFLPQKRRTALYGWAADSDLRAKSSSGGAFSTIVEGFLDDTGYVCGAAFQDNYTYVSHSFYQKDSYAPLRKSKYVFSDISDSYIVVENILKCGKRILFSGTPCQVAGLRAFLGKESENENLLTVDFICHGTPSIKAYQEHLQAVTKGENATCVDFRSKSFGWFQHCLLIETEDGEKYLKKSDEDWYMYHFLHNYSLRKCCYDCPYSNGNHVSDITLADFWGIKNYRPEINDEKGISLIIFNSNQGRSMQAFIESKMECWPLQEKDYAYVFKDHSYYSKSAREMFFKVYKEKGYSYMADNPTHFYHENESIYVKSKKKVKGVMHKMKNLAENLRGGVLNNVTLAPYTTIKIGGKAQNFYFPETIDELKMILDEYPSALIMGGGSNLLINDQKEFDHVICLRKFEDKVDYLPDGKVRVGSGLSLQKLIRDINAHGKGGIEYLYSVPGLVGGAIVMNAGRGASYHKQISDYLVTIEYLENGKLQTVKKEDCDFSFRHSMFQDKNTVIVGADFLFEEITPEEGRKRCQERLDFVKKTQDNRYPNAGTTFCECDKKIMTLMKKTSGKKQQGVHFSAVKENWLQNRGEGTYEEAMNLIHRVEKLHSRAGKKCRLEYVVWE